MSSTHDAIVIGAGIIGCAITYELAKGGRNVLCVDKNPGAGAGSTGSSCAIIRTHYSTVNGAALAKAGYPYWTGWREYLEAGEEDGPFARYREVGCICTCSEQNQYGAKLEEIAIELDIPYEVWTPALLRKRLPIANTGRFFPPKRPEDPAFGVSPDDLRYVLFFPRAGYISDPQLATRNVQQAAERHGAHFRFRQRVSAISREGGKVRGVTLESGERHEAPIVVNVAGPHSARINEMAGVLGDMSIRTRPLRVEVAHVRSPRGFDFESDGMIGSDNDIGGYWRPEVGNHLLVGSHDPECDPHQWVDPDDYDTNLSEQARVQVMRAAQRFPELLVPDSVKGVVDLYDASDDWIPIYDRSELDGYYMAVGTSGNQFKNAQVAGMLMKALIDYVESGGDHDAKPLQYPLPNTDFVLDTAYCSRKRPINRESSFSVIG